MCSELMCCTVIMFGEAGATVSLREGLGTNCLSCRFLQSPRTAVFNNANPLFICHSFISSYVQDDAASVSDGDARHGGANTSMQLGGRYAYGGRMDVSMMGEDSNSMDVERMMQQ